MVIFAAVAMVITVIAGLQLLLETRGATHDPADAQVYGFLATIGLGTPVVWAILNLAILTWRQQTGGQYVAGVRVVRQDGRTLSARDAAAWWFCLNPVLFSWPMAVMTAFPLALVVSLVLSRLGIVAFGVVLTLCLAAPILALVSALLDQQNRALHDRIVGVLVVPVE
jgi:uncharacterized RDD family membrane protein YckC